MSDLDSARSVRYLRPLQDFVRTEAASGVLLLLMVVLALFWANGPWSDSYDKLWHTVISVSFGSSALELDLRHWVNEGLMALFFFVVGLEIKRELTDGQLNDPRKAMLPAFAALGGMAVPALLYVAITWGHEGGGLRGWGVPMATDIAIVLGVLSLLGKRVSTELKTFLLTLAIVDDVGAILVIAFYYSGSGIDVGLLALASLAFIAYWALQRAHRFSAAIPLVVGCGAWLALANAGLHATLAGVVLALLTPSRPIANAEYIDADALKDVSDLGAASQTVSLARSSISTVEWLQYVLHPWSSYWVLPIFALANAGVALSSDAIAGAASSRVTLGVIAGLLIGKPVGILLMTFVARRFLGATIPDGVTMRLVGAASVLAGIGFTVSLFVTDLAFTDAALEEEAKVGVLAASIVAGVLGFIVLRLTSRRQSVE